MSQHHSKKKKKRRQCIKQAAGSNERTLHGDGFGMRLLYESFTPSSVYLLLLHQDGLVQRLSYSNQNPQSG